MNENIDLKTILKDCPEGTKLYSTIFGDVTFCYIGKNAEFPIILTAEGGYNFSVSANGRHYVGFDGECTLFPSRDQRDWSKFTAPLYKKEKFDPKTLKPFDKVLVRNFKTVKWRCEHFSNFDGDNYNPCIASCCSYTFCIPYNEETKHLVGTKEEAPDFYKYWED